MRHLPALRPGGSAPDWQVERLSRWLVEWSIDQAFPAADLEIRGDFAEADMLPRGLVAPYDPDARPGQIRLLAGHASERLVYVGILREDGDGRFLRSQRLESSWDAPLSRPVTFSEASRVFDCWSMLRPRLSR